MNETSRIHRIRNCNVYIQLPPLVYLLNHIVRLIGWAKGAQATPTLTTGHGRTDFKIEFITLKWGCADAKKRHCVIPLMWLQTLCENISDLLFSVNIGHLDMWLVNSLIQGT